MDTKALLSRKRPRIDSRSLPQTQTPRAPCIGAYTSSNPYSNDPLAASISSIASPSPLANTEYFLDGGLDTPGAWRTDAEERALQLEAEQDYRLNRCTSRPTLGSREISLNDLDNAIMSISDRNRALVKRMNRRGANNGSSSLTGFNIRETVWSLTGGLAGKIFNFCINTTFRGFRAGGGATYPSPSNTLDTGDDAAGDGGGDSDFDSPRPSHHRHSRNNSSSTILAPPTPTRSISSANAKSRIPRPSASYSRPGPSPTSSNQYQDSTDSTTHAGWSFIERSEALSPQSHSRYRPLEEQSPVRKRSRASYAGSVRQQQDPPIHFQPVRPPSSSSSRTASFASPRSRTASRATSYHHGNPTRPLAAPLSPHRRNVTTTTTRATTTLASPIKRQASSSTLRERASERNREDTVPVSPEVQAFKKQKRRDERRQDEQLFRMNAHLADLIRQGQQALGSKVEVYEDQGGGGVFGGERGYGVLGEVTDEGYYEEEEDDGWAR